jgi:hypothetical protein
MGAAATSPTTGSIVRALAESASQSYEAENAVLSVGARLAAGAARQFDLLKEYDSTAIPFVIPPISDWTSPDQFNTVPSGIQKQRGGKRGRKT